MRQLEVLASDCGQQPAALASAWVIEHLVQLSGASGSPTTLSAVAKPTPLKAVKEMLAKKYVTDPDEKTLFLQTTRFKQWANYIAGHVLTMNGQKTFTKIDVRDILKKDLIPLHYGTSGAQENEILTPDVRVDAPHDYPRGYPCLKRVGPGRYEFIGLRAGIRERYGEQTLRDKLSNKV
jgi:hypothetical protein